jgi:hypothetical protein
MEQIPLAELGKYGLAGTVVSIAIWVAWSYKGDTAAVGKRGWLTGRGCRRSWRPSNAVLASVSSAWNLCTRAQEESARALAVLTAEVQRLRDELLRIREDRRGNEMALRSGA